MIVVRTGLPADVVAGIERQAEQEARELIARGGLTSDEVGEACNLPAATIRALRRAIQQEAA